jgi:hypothetical protein
MLSGMQRLAVLLTGLYLIGISLYAVIVWRLETTENMATRSPLVFREAVKFNGEREIVVPGVVYMGNIYSEIVTRFDWLVFGVVAVGGVGAIWLLLPGTAWMINGFRSGSKPPEEPANPV